ncbi:hypothetical protein GGQ87_002187 [Brevundimonas alba]|uniref:Uncharacterized protein n=1 Tax=Brevundimonas alba TaxID=74314 RepID=A0A7X5YL18_9CAUL|nr:hypothetical protein [Brevundimonas alba]NJC41892.1 hypothetical protein [Brevundimonas alba]
MRRSLALAFALLGLATAPALAQSAPDPVPIEEWSLEKVGAMGQAIYQQDVAAWVATDALLAHLAGAPPPPGTSGWIVVDEGETQRVRFVRQDQGSLKSAFDVLVREGRAGPVEVVADGALSAQEKASFLARQTAIANIGRLRCSQSFNTVVLDDSDSDGWLVWLLTATTDADIIPMGGHYRFRISADGSTVLRRDMLSNGCLNMPRQPTDDQGQPVALAVSQIVSQGPVETHVFLSLQNRMPIYVIAGDRIFEVNGPQIGKVDP